MNDNNYYTIQGWMRTRLGLKGNELITYAIIYGFSQDNQSVFSGTLGYLADWIGVSKQAVCSILKKLVEQDLIVKIEKTVNGVTFYDYKASQKTLTTIKENLTPIKETLTTPIKETLTASNNINNIYNNNNIYIPKNQKNGYGEFQNVMLTKDEVKKLIAKYGLLFQDAVELLSNYIASVGKDKYKNHYAVMKENGWVWEKVHKTPNVDMKKLQLVSDGNGSYREETIEEYYKRTMNLDLD